MLSLESTSSRMNRLAKHEMHFGSFLTIDEMLAAIDARAGPTRCRRCSTACSTRSSSRLAHAWAAVRTTARPPATT